MVFDDAMSPPPRSPADGAAGAASVVTDTV